MPESHASRHDTVPAKADARSHAYRPEIDGLRAIAVMAVILHHAGWPLLEGGYLGVDVFFVISGYLITGIIVREIEARTFTLAGFWERRVRRILPALIVVMLLTSICALALMLPDDLENFGQSLVATSLFANNVLLLVTSGYFSLEASFKPLLHTWSLAVEEQYYIAAPLVVLAAARIGGRRAVLAVLLVISAASLAFSIWASVAIPRADFLLITSRAWQLGVGGAAALLQADVAGKWPAHSLAARALSSLGLALICLSMLHIDVVLRAPDTGAVLPVLGTLLVLLLASAREGAGRLLSLWPIAGLGLISYSAYLYHQPVFALARITSLEEPPLALLLSLIPIVLLLAWGSWRLVEQPFRDRSRISRRTLAWTLAPASAGLIALGLALHFTSGLHARWPELAEHDAGFGSRQNAAFNLEPQTYLDRQLPQQSSRARLLVIGNSHARDFINMVRETGRAEVLEISYAKNRSCALDDEPEPLRANLGRADVIVIATPFSACTTQQVARLQRDTRASVAVIGPKSFGWNNNAVMLVPAPERYRLRVSPLTAVRAESVRATARLPATVYVDVLAMLADGQGKVPVFTPEGRFISQDRIHLTRAGARFVGELVLQHPAFGRLKR